MAFNLFFYFLFERKILIEFSAGQPFCFCLPTQITGQELSFTQDHEIETPGLFSLP